MARASCFVASLAVVLLLFPVSSHSEENVSEIKSIEIMSHAPPGGLYDLHSRLLARHLGKHLPGNPTPVVKNMPGGGGLIQANYLFNRARPDGRTIGLLAAGVVQMEALAMPGIHYRSRRFGWIGLISNSTPFIVSRRDAPIRSLEDLLDATKEPLVVGISAPPSDLYTIPAGLNMILGKQIGRPVFKLVRGYAGIGALIPALERGEVDGVSWTWDGIRGSAPHYLEPAPGKGFLNLIGYVAPARWAEFEKLGLPLISERIRDPKDRAVMDFLTVQSQTMLSVVAPPGVPTATLRILREAFLKTVKDQAYIADALKARQTPRPLPGEKLENIVASILNTPEEIVGLAKRVFED